MSIGQERKPRGEFELMTSEDGDVVSLTLHNDVVMMHEFSTSYTWPGEYTNITDNQYQQGKRLFLKLHSSNRQLTCSRQDDYLKQKKSEAHNDRRKHQRKQSRLPPAVIPTCEG